MDNMKKWAEKNRTKADKHFETNLDSLWEGIDKGLNKSRRFPFYSQKWLRWAAGLILLLVAGGLFFFPSQPREGFALYQVSPELADTEFYYSSQLGEKMEIIQSSGIEIDPRLYSDLEQLGEVYKDLMKDLKDNADNEEVVQAMIQNYRIRLQMLEQILNEIQEDEKEESDETNI